MHVLPSTLNEEKVLSAFSNVPNLEGDPKYSKRGPKGDLILSKKGDLKGTKKWTQDSSCSKNLKELKCLNFPGN